MLNDNMSFSPAIKYDIKHGVKMKCPTCSAPGRKDDMLKPDGSNGGYAGFEDAIWWNSFDKHWECYDCWLK